MGDIDLNFSDILEEVDNDKRLDFSTDELVSINFWKFLNVVYLQLDRFFTLLDIEEGSKTGWEKFVEILGLQLWEDRKWCRHYHNGRGPTRAALSRLLQKEDYDRDISLAAILEIIKEMGRHDILLTINWNELTAQYKKFAPDVNFNYNKEQMPVVVEPLLLKLNYQGETVEINQSTEQMKRNSKSRRPCIMLCYAEDTLSDASRIAQQLRVNGKNKKEIGVILVHDKSLKKLLSFDNNNTLHKWFNQVRYIVPILSPDYLKHIQNICCVDDAGFVTMTSLINRMIYRLLHDQFVVCGSRNYRCRPICPDRFKKQVRMHPVVCGNGLFTNAWSDNMDDIENLAKALLDKPISP